MILNNHWFIIKMDRNVKSDPINVDNISDIVPSYIETPPSFSNYILSVKSDIYNFVCDNFFEDSEDNNLQFIVSFDPTILDLYTDYIRFKSKYEFSINNYYKLIEDIILEQDIESKIPKNFIFLDSLRRLKNKKIQEEVFYDRCKFLSHDLELVRDTNLLEIDEEINEICLSDIERKKEEENVEKVDKKKKEKSTSIDEDLINKIIESSQRNIPDDLNVPDDDHSEKESYK